MYRIKINKVSQAKLSCTFLNQCKPNQKKKETWERNNLKFNFVPWIFSQGKTNILRASSPFWRLAQERRTCKSEGIGKGFVLSSECPISSRLRPLVYETPKESLLVHRGQTSRAISFALFREISFTMRWKNKQGYI